jgi:hypothetical protein
LSTNIDIKAELEAVFGETGRLLNGSGTAQEIANAFWDDDVRVLSADRFYPDLESWLKDFQSETGREHSAQFSFVGEPQISEDLAAVFVHEHEELPEPADFRMLCVLRKGPRGWRVIMEMWGPGTFNT